MITKPIQIGRFPAGNGLAASAIGKLGHMRE
jgi:hypothetical protein